MSETKKQVVVDITIAAPIASVWTALRDPAQLENWFGWDAPTLAEEIRFIFIDGATADAERHIVKFGEWEGVTDTIELTTEGTGTRLRLVRAGGAPIDWTGTYEDITQGWINFFQQLRLALERHPGQRRRTIYLSGPARPGVGAPSAELGLAEASRLSPGASYHARLGPGEDASGMVWYRTHFQTAVTVEQWGDGLLVVTDMGVSNKRPHGAGSILATTYGLNDARFAQLEQRWKDWWSARYPAPAA
jgi:uncharacterized protein YndB with AHSA1/START domain